MEEQFRIGSLAQKLGVKRFVIRFWEKEFGISSHRTSGGQRFYLQQDFDQFKLIKELLYNKGFTISGAKKVLLQATKKSAFIKPDAPELASEKLSLEKNQQKFYHQVLLLKTQLQKLSDLL